MSYYKTVYLHVGSKQMLIDSETEDELLDQFFKSTNPIQDTTDLFDIEPDGLVYDLDSMYAMHTFVQETKDEQVYQSDTIDTYTKLNNLMVKYINNPELKKSLYKQFRIPKKTGGFRTITAPQGELMQAMHDVSRVFKKLKVLPHDAAWAYVQGRSIKGAMERHTDNQSRWFLKIDLKDFFGSCNKEFIINQLRKLYPLYAGGTTGMQYRFCEYIAEFATLDDSLPQGTPISPWLTNLVMVEFDVLITKLLGKKFVYTRYADDIIISCKYNFEYTKILDKIKEIFKDTPLEINTDKTRYGSSSGRNWNLGVMINKENKITVGYRRKRETKVMIHNMMKNQDSFTLADWQYFLGQLNWIQQIEQDYFEGLMEYLDRKYYTSVMTLILNKIKELS